MDIPSLSTMASLGTIQNQASLMVMKKVMDMGQQNGQAMTDLLVSAAPKLSPPYLGQTIDISA